MFITADQINASGQANLDAVHGLAVKAYSGFEKLVELNMAATKAIMNESFSHAKAVMAAKDPQQALALQTGLVAPMAEKAVSYGRHVQAILADAGSEFSKVAESKASEGQKALGQVIENIAKNAPAGTESAVAVLKTAMTSSQNAIESAQKAAKQALSMAEANVTKATEQVLNAANAAAKTA